MGNKLKLTMACSPYDRLRGIMDGTCEPEGIDLNFIPLEVEETFWRQIKHDEFDVSEISFSMYTANRARGDDKYICIPVFTSRSFRHSCVFINAHKGIEKPEDLKGKIVGVPEYQMTAALWIRGIFEDEYGIKPSDLIWRQGGEENPGREEKLKMPPNLGIDLAAIPNDKTLNQMLDNGEIDALFTARTPSSFDKGSPNVKRLFDDPMKVEGEYYKKTRIFPIMHTICIKREIYNENPWIAMSLYKALRKSKDQVIKNMKETVALPFALPWLVFHAQYTQEVMGEDWWPYGIEPNRNSIEALCRYSFNQGLSPKLMTPEDLFAPESFDEFKI